MKSEWIYSPALPPSSSRSENLSLIPGLEKRQFQRTDCLVPVSYEVKGHNFKDVLRNISEGGGYLQTFRAFSVGEEISLELPPQDHGEKVVGDIVWVGPEGIGVKFRIPGQALMEKLVPGQENQTKGFNITKKEATEWAKSEQETSMGTCGR